MQKVIPAILTADSTELASSLMRLRNATKWVHVDIMDGKFVPNTSVNLFELGEAQMFFNLEIHLMVESPEKYFEDCKEIGAKRVIIHLEAVGDMSYVLKEMEKHPFQRAVAINPPMPVSKLAPYIEKLDSTLVMSVNPGFQAQEFIPDVLSKIAEIRQLKQDSVVGIDGGINEATIKQAFAAGIDYAEVGSAVMKAADPIAALRKLEEMVQ